jgi:hypothetical protein
MGYDCCHENDERITHNRLPQVLFRLFVGCQPRPAIDLVEPFERGVKQGPTFISVKIGGRTQGGQFHLRKEATEVGTSCCDEVAVPTAVFIAAAINQEKAPGRRYIWDFGNYVLCKKIGVL